MRETERERLIDHIVMFEFKKKLSLELYQHEGDKKSAQALPNMMKLAASMANNNEDMAGFDYEINKTSKKERVAGYKCDIWEGKSDEQDFEAWITKDLGVDWSSNFSQVASQFTSNSSYAEAWKKMEGLALKSITYDGETKNISSTMVVTEVSKKAFAIDNSEYTFGYE